MTIKFNDNLTTVSGSAFYQSGLEAVTFPASLTNLADQSFRDCYDLTKVVFLGTTPPSFLTNVFYNTPQSPKLYVPVDCAAAYKAKLSAVGSVIGTNNSGKAIDNVRGQITISKYGYNSYYLANENFKVPDGVTAYVVTGSEKLADGKQHAVVETFVSGTAVPKAQGFIIEALGHENVTLDYEASVTVGEQAVTGTNLMRGTAVGETFSGEDGTYYVLSPDPADPTLIGFYFQKGTAGNSMVLKAHYAGLFLPTGTVAPSKRFLMDLAQTTGISTQVATDRDSEKTCYDLQGRRVNNPVHGLFIVGGKKVLMK